ncbi:hypothetical protein [Longimicrobium sp.]|nr:hypothetical protein [Longimicrobium sp.]HEX6038855.1 hypothetical protein [Longimicrobium sp.]
MSLDLNQLVVETFEVSEPSALAGGSVYMPIVSTDQVPHCDGATADC